MGFIYKITNTESRKCYIGETKEGNPLNRWKKHLQVIKNNRGCPALRDAIKKYGVEKFIFEVLIVCFDEDRFKFEKEYIKKYNSQVPNGYNILPGGEGGGFLGKNHTEETKEILRIKSKDNSSKEEVKERSRKVAIEYNNTNNISELVKQSKKFKKALAEGRVGGKAHKDGKPSEETKQKIKKSLISYYKSKDTFKIDIEKHKDIMTKITGRKVTQFTIDNSFVKEYRSISEAGRTSGVKKTNIQRVLCGATKTAGGFIWKYADKAT